MAASASVEPGTKAIILEKDPKVILAQILAEGNEFLVVGHLVVDRFDNVENGVGVYVLLDSCAEGAVRLSAQLGLKILVGSLVKVEQEPPLLFASDFALDGELVDIAKDVPECIRIVVFQLDRFMSALLVRIALALLISA